WVFFFQAEDGIRDRNVTGVQTCALPIFPETRGMPSASGRSTVLTTRSAVKSGESRAITVAWITWAVRPREAMWARTCSAISEEGVIAAPQGVAMVSMRAPGVDDGPRGARPCGCRAASSACSTPADIDSDTLRLHGA